MTRIVENFFSIQGEGKRTGIPSLFIRSFGCNCGGCPGFGQKDPADKSTWKTFKIELGKSPRFGCDSPCSWYPPFKDLAKEYASGKDFFEEIKEKYTNQQLKELVITGGEPLLHQKFWLEFFAALETVIPNPKVTFETNGIIKPNEDFDDFIREHKNFSFLFSVSPKLNCVAGVDEKLSINYDTLNYYAKNFEEGLFDLQLKFVFNGEERAFNKVKEIYGNLSTKIEPHNILLMPVGAWETEKELRIKTAEACIKEGFRYCARVHVDIWGKRTGV